MGHGKQKQDRDLETSACEWSALEYAVAEEQTPAEASSFVNRMTIIHIYSYLVRKEALKRNNILRL